MKMERLILRAVFCIFAILLGCLGVQSRPFYLQDANIDLMWAEVHCHVPNTTFYTPLARDRECIPAAVRCILVELKEVVKTECDDPGNHVNTAVHFWDTMQKEIEPGNSENEMIVSKCRCELWPQTPFHTFLDAAKSLIQFINDHDNIIKETAV